jgi:hypothetical protein
MPNLLNIRQHLKTFVKKYTTDDKNGKFPITTVTQSSLAKAGKHETVSEDRTFFIF